MMVLTVTLKGILKVCFRLIISLLVRSLEKFWKACNKIYKLSRVPVPVSTKIL